RWSLAAAALPPGIRRTSGQSPHVLHVGVASERLRRVRESSLADCGRLFNQPGVPEAAHFRDDREQGVALARQLILDPRRGLRVAPPFDDALVLECAETFRQRPRADAGAGVLELREAPRSLGQVVDE